MLYQVEKTDLKNDNAETKICGSPRHDMAQQNIILTRFEQLKTTELWKALFGQYGDGFYELPTRFLASWFCKI
jgi:hypothetical protein